MHCAIIQPARLPLRGTVNLPGDKSLSHRRALMSLFTDGDVRLTHFTSGADGQSTLNCLARLCKKVVREGNSITISGPADCKSADLDCGNSGTTARLLMGILAGRKGEWTLTGDESLSHRPMERVADPLRKMGARIELTDGHLPARIIGSPLQGITYESPVASAQVKSAVLFAALQASGVTRYRETLPSRDHTERLLGLSLDREGRLNLDPDAVHVSVQEISGSIPGDPSAAVFFIAAAILIPGSEIFLPGMLVNPLRTAYFDILVKAGAPIQSENLRTLHGETVADVRSKYSPTPIAPFQIDGSLAVSCMDEIPALSILAACAQGSSIFKDIGELRVKESDRLELIAKNLHALGVSIDSTPDELRIHGIGTLHGAQISTANDHRIAMAFAIAGLIASGQTVVDDGDCVAISDPAFWNELNRLCPGSVTLETIP
jgi:3-phosphoshikimate 1-carboxyvinyltransferase